MSTFLRNIAVALGITTIALAWIVQPVLVPGHQVVYHWSGSSAQLFAPVFLDIAILWTVLASLLLWAQAPGRVRIGVWGALILFMPSLVLKSIGLFTNYRAPHWFDVALFALALILYGLLLVVWRPAFELPLERIVAFATTMLAFVGISGVIFLLQLTWLAVGSRSLNRPRPLHHSQPPAFTAATSSAAKPRILWIVLDELSYQQVYERRYPGLRLPAFDALAAQATVFSKVVPAGIVTEEALPSLLTGREIDKVRSSPAGELSIHDEQAKSWKPFDPRDTVFQDALDAGYSTALAGWWNPYCRILPAVLDQCYWVSRVGAVNRITPGETIAQNMVEPLGNLVRTGSLRELLGHFMRMPQPDSVSHSEEYQELFAAADKVLDDPSAGLVFVHLPIPHPPGIYNRVTGQLTSGPSTYIDNLALADRYLAHIRSSLEQNGQWNNCTLIIMGDHGWRTQLLWLNAPGWTPEEDRASQGGQFDDRPGYIVKLPDQQSGDRIDLPFRAVDTRKLVDALLKQQIGSAQTLHTWVQQTVHGESAQPGR